MSQNVGIVLVMAVVNIHGYLDSYCWRHLKAVLRVTCVLFTQEHACACILYSRLLCTVILLETQDFVFGIWPMLYMLQMLCKEIKSLQSRILVTWWLCTCYIPLLSDNRNFGFYRATPCVSAVFAVARCLSFCLSVLVSVCPSICP